MSAAAGTAKPPLAPGERPGVGAFFLDELRQQFRSRGLWICFGIMALMFYRYVSESYWDELVGSGRVPVNSPIVIYYIFAFSTYWAAIFATSFLTSPVLRDLRYSVAPIVYAMPFRDRDYLIGKYLAGQVALIFVMSGVFLGFVLLSWLKPSLGAESLHSYMPMPWGQAIHSFALFLVPACFFFGSVHFALAALSGRMTPSYAFAVIVTLVFLSFELSFQGDTFAKRWPEILDPVGYITLQGQVFYWTAEQRVSQYIQLNETMLLNRALYITLGAAALLFLAGRANLRGLIDKARGKGSKERRAMADKLPAPAAPTVRSRLRTDRTPNVGVRLLDLTRVGWAQFLRCARESWFIIALLAGFIMAFCLSLRLGALYRLPEGVLLPTALDILDQPVEMYVIVGIIVVAFAVGEIISRERIARVQSIVDASPVSNGFLIGSKLVACGLIVITFTLTPAVATLSVQLLKGYYDIEWNLYWYRFVCGVLPSLATYAAVAAFIHIVVNQRAVGHALATIVCFSVFMMEEIEVVEHPLLLLGLPVLIPLTSFDGLAQFNAKLLQLNAYYLAVGGALLIIASVLWARGLETRLWQRVGTATQRIRAPVLAGAATCIGIAALSGAGVYAAINAEGDYKTIEAKKGRDAEYERRFAALAEVPQPKVVAARIALDLEPAARQMQYAAALVLENRRGQPIDRLELEGDPFVEITCVAVRDACISASAADAEFRRYRYPLQPPLAPGERREVRIEAAARFRGYSSKGVRGRIVQEGSFITDALWPAMGYERSQELTLTGDRRFHGLGPRRKLPPRASATSITDLAVSSQADLMDYELIVSTDADQQVIAPGRLLSTETIEGRRVSHYAGSDALWNFAIASAAYRNSVLNPATEGGVRISVHYLPEHAYNVERFLSAAQRAASRFSSRFGPLPYSEIRLVEVPQNIADKARTAGNTIFIPEKDGWVHDYRTPPARDWLLYTVAREVARMWWGQQVTAGEMLGSLLITESVPEYLALEIVEEVHGPAAAQDLLAMKRDIYLRQRVKEDTQEPSVLESDDEPYMEEKGLLALFSARAVLGPERMQAALTDYFHGARPRRAPPFASAAELLASLEHHAGDDLQRGELRSAFTETRLYDFQLRQARYRPGEPDGHLFEMEIDAERFDVTATSNHARTDFSLPVPVAFIGSEYPESAPYVTSTTLKSGRNNHTLALPFRPTRVVLDPFGRFVDQNVRDNARGVSAQ